MTSSPAAAGVLLPALNGREPLGFLAALGALAVLRRRVPDVRLSFVWPHPTAVLSGTGMTAVDDITAHLVDAFDDLAPDELIPGVRGYPLAPSWGGRGGDPSRLALGDVPEFLRRIRAENGDTAADWVARIINPYVADFKGRARLTPFIAPTGRQSVDGFFRSPREAMREDPRRLFHEALTGWVRVDGVNGQGLDVHAVVSAGESGDGVPYGRAVPGATWLATMALEITALSATSEGVAQATLWQHHVPSGRSLMLWPLWTRPLGYEAVRLLLQLDHLVLSAYRGPDGEPVVIDRRPDVGADPQRIRDVSLDPFQIVELAAAHREMDRHHDGPLTAHSVRVGRPHRRRS